MVIQIKSAVKKPKKRFFKKSEEISFKKSKEISKGYSDQKGLKKPKKRFLKNLKKCPKNMKLYKYIIYIAGYLFVQSRNYYKTFVSFSIEIYIFFNKIKNAFNFALDNEQKVKVVIVSLFYIFLFIFFVEFTLETGEISDQLEAGWWEDHIKKKSTLPPFDPKNIEIKPLEVTPEISRNMNRMLKKKAGNPDNMRMYATFTLWLQEIIVRGDSGDLVGKGLGMLKVWHSGMKHPETSYITLVFQLDDLILLDKKEITSSIFKKNVIGIEPIVELYKNMPIEGMKGCTPIDGLRWKLFDEWFDPAKADKGQRHYYLVDFPGALDITDIMAYNSAYGGDSEGNVIDYETSYTIFKAFMKKEYTIIQVKDADELREYYKK